MKNMKKMLTISLAVLCLAAANAGAAPDIAVERDVMVPMRDGVKLAADIYRLKDAPPGPVLLARTPYDKTLTWPGRTTDLTRFVRAGYAVVIQDVRGRYASEGEFVPHANETEDGLDCLKWVAEQPWSNGRVGAFGGSYLGGTQWLPARKNPPMLQAMVPEITFSDMYACTHQGGVKVLHDLRWAAASILRDAVRRRAAAGEAVPPESELPDVDTVLHALPLAGHPLIQKYTPFYREWLAHPTPDAYWAQMSPNAGYPRITAPALNISGWYDIFVQETLRNYRGMRDSGAGRGRIQKLVIGPWSHMNFTGAFPERDFGPEASFAAIDLDGMKLRWYDRWLKDAPNGVENEDPVLIFVMGIDQWRSEKDWPLPDTRYEEYFLHSGGAANTLSGDGGLSPDRPKDEAADAFVSDPLNPVPTVGGQVILPGDNAIGPRDQREVERRPDVLVYTTPPLTEPLEVTGNVSLKLFVASDAPDADFAAKLVDVYPDGRAMILTGGIQRARWRGGFARPELLEQGRVYELDIDLLATANVFLPGHRIRLEVAGSNFPQFARNSQTGGDIAEETAEQYRKATNTVHHSAASPSRLILPVIRR